MARAVGQHPQQRRRPFGFGAGERGGHRGVGVVDRGPGLGQQGGHLRFGQVRRRALQPFQVLDGLGEPPGGAVGRGGPPVPFRRGQHGRDLVGDRPDLGAARDPGLPLRLGDPPPRLGRAAGPQRRAGRAQRFLPPVGLTGRGRAGADRPARNVGIARNFSIARKSVSIDAPSSAATAASTATARGRSSPQRDRLLQQVRVVVGHQAVLDQHRGPHPRPQVLGDVHGDRGQVALDRGAPGSSSSATCTSSSSTTARSRPGGSSRARDRQAPTRARICSSAAPGGRSSMASRVGGAGCSVSRPSSSSRVRSCRRRSGPMAGGAPDAVAGAGVVDTRCRRSRVLDLVAGQPGQRADLVQAVDLVRRHRAVPVHQPADRRVQQRIAAGVALLALGSHPGRRGPPPPGVEQLRAARGVGGHQLGDQHPVLGVVALPLPEPPDLRDPFRDPPVVQIVDRRQVVELERDPRCPGRRAARRPPAPACGSRCRRTSRQRVSHGGAACRAGPAPGPPRPATASRRWSRSGSAGCPRRRGTR